MRHLEELGGDSIKVFIDSLLGVVNERSPDVHHGVPDTGIWIVLVAVQLGHQGCNVGLQPFPSQLGNGCESAGMPHDQT